VSDATQLVRELRTAGYAEWTISCICRTANRVFKFARRYCAWRGDNAFAELELGERPRVSTTRERRSFGRQAGCDDRGGDGAVAHAVPAPGLDEPSLPQTSCGKSVGNLS
jgi:hypothetical protein